MQAHTADFMKSNSSPFSFLTLSEVTCMHCMGLKGCRINDHRLDDLPFETQPPPEPISKH